MVAKYYRLRQDCKADTAAIAADLRRAQTTPATKIIPRTLVPTDQGMQAGFGAGRRVWPPAADGLT